MAQTAAITVQPTRPGMTVPPLLKCISAGMGKGPALLTS